MANKKLIEVALPLEKINEASVREKSIRHGHPSTLHLWWARRPLAAARAVIWASLVDDPSSHPELFPTEESQNIERQRLFKILEDLVVWENSNNQQVLDAAKTEILRSTNGNPPALLDPFAGGGAIPFEAMRLGLEAHAHDLNPVAVVINKSMIEIPSRFSNCPPVNPVDSIDEFKKTWSNSLGLAADVEYYGNMLKNIAKERLGDMYPPVSLPQKFGGGNSSVISWIWARTIKCPNPSCGKTIPLASSFVLSTKKGNSAWIEPYEENGIVKYIVNEGKCPDNKKTIKLGKGASFKCVCCGAVIDKEYIHGEFVKKKISSALMAIVGEGNNRRYYLNPDQFHEDLANSILVEDKYLGEMDTKSPNLVSGRGYGIAEWSELFTNRQYTLLTAICAYLKEVIHCVEKDAIHAGFKDDDIGLNDGGTGAKAYAQAVGVYLSFVISKLADRGSTACSWDSSREGLRNTFGRQAIPMVWDYAESNPFCDSSGSFNNMLNWVVKCIEQFPKPDQKGYAVQFNAQEDCGLSNIMISTDPPYYDNIEYSSLSDYFYIWMRKSIGDIYPDLFSTIQVPKTSELIAVPSRFDGDMSKAKGFFENGMYEACKQIYKYSTRDIPVTIYYAYKQSETDDSMGKSSSGWETMLSAIINAGFTITGTWPIRTEMANRQIASGTNALASSIVLACRKRDENAPQITRRGLINVLRQELKLSLNRLRSSNIAPVDLAQSAIGPGMAVFSRYSKVLEADGSEMSVRSALQVINEELDLYFNEQVGDLDSMSRFCIDLYTQSAFNDIPFGQADVLARAKGTSVDAIASHGPVFAKGGKVHLIDRDQLPDKIDHNENCIWMFAQQLTQLMATGGVDACAKAIYDMMGSNAEKAKDLAYRLYTIAEQKKWANEAYAYNALVVAWPDIQARAAELKAERPEQMNLFDY